jgi:hypothetical protein
MMNQTFNRWTLMRLNYFLMNQTRTEDNQNEEATEDEMDSETSYYCLNGNFENVPTTSKS